METSKHPRTAALDDKFVQFVDPSATEDPPLTKQTTLNPNPKPLIRQTKARTWSHKARRLPADSVAGGSLARSSEFLQGLGVLLAVVCNERSKGNFPAEIYRLTKAVEGRRLSSHAHALLLVYVDSKSRIVKCKKCTFPYSRRVPIS